MIANRIREYLEGPGIPVPEDWLSVAGAACAYSMNRNLGEFRLGEARKAKMPRPSGSWACGRQQVFDSLGLATEGYGWRSRLTFTHGDMTETMAVMLFRLALLWKNEESVLVTPGVDGVQDELEATFDPSVWGVEGAPFTLTGHLDMSIQGHADSEDPCDWKAINRYAFQNLSKAASDSSADYWSKEAGGYIAQVRWYMMMLRVLGRGGERGYLVGVCKDTGHVAELLIQRDEAAEKLLVQKAVYTLRAIEEAGERQAMVFQADDADFLGNEETDDVLSEFVRERVPRAKFTNGMDQRTKGKVVMPNGERGRCMELVTGGANAPSLEAFRCSYCDHTARCWPGYSVVAQARGPVWRTSE